MDGSGLLLLGHAATHQLDEGILQRRLAFLDPSTTRITPPSAASLESWRLKRSMPSCSETLAAATPSMARSASSRRVPGLN
jgi:hypothetical protein